MSVGVSGRCSDCRCVCRVVLFLGRCLSPRYDLSDTFSGRSSQLCSRFTDVSSAYLAYCLIPHCRPIDEFVQSPHWLQLSEHLSRPPCSPASAVAMNTAATPNHALEANSGLWRSVTGRASHPTGLSHGLCCRHEARTGRAFALAPACSTAAPRPGVLSLGSLGGRYALTENTKTTHQ